MPTVDSVLLSVEERDKWRHRAELLERRLSEVRHQLRTAQVRLRAVRRELSLLHSMTRASPTPAVLRAVPRSPDAPSNPQLGLR